MTATQGPESEARPELPARERVAEYYRTLWGYAEHNDQTWQAADRALEAMRPEIEQLLFERDAAQATADNIAQQLEGLRDDVLGDDSLHVLEVASAAGREVERLTAELSEIRAVLVAADPKADLPNHAVVPTVDIVRAVAAQRDEQGRMAVELFDLAKARQGEIVRLTAEVERLRALWPLNGFGEDTDVRQLIANHRAWTQAAQEGASCLREQLAAQTLRANVHQERGDLLVVGLRRLLDNDRGIENGPAPIELDESDASSSEVEASQPRQHSVHTWKIHGVWQGLCVTFKCGQRFRGTEQEVSDWKDQHEADTLRPVGLTPEQAADELCRETRELFEGRPSGSERLAPRPVETPEVWVESPNGADYTATYETQLAPATVVEDAAQPPTSEATLEDPSLQPAGFKVGDEVRWCWSGDNADGTWFKARLTEKHPANYPKGWSGEITDCGTAYTAEHMGEVPLGFHVYMDIPSMTLVSGPSPSLPKEGEDQ